MTHDKCFIKCQEFKVLNIYGSMYLISKQKDCIQCLSRKMNVLFFNPVYLLGHEKLRMTQKYSPEDCGYKMSSPRYCSFWSLLSVKVFYANEFRSCNLTGTDPIKWMIAKSQLSFISKKTNRSKWITLEKLLRWVTFFTKKNPWHLEIFCCCWDNLSIYHCTCSREICSHFLSI